VDTRTYAGIRCVSRSVSIRQRANFRNDDDEKLDFQHIFHFAIFEFLTFAKSSAVRATKSAPVKKRTAACVRYPEILCGYWLFPSLNLHYFAKGEEKE
jgi:hypothetical protein